MSWNGSGTYSLPPASFPEVTGTTIEAARFNNTLNDVATALNNVLTRDGQNSATSNLPMGGFKHTGAANATAAGEYLVYGQTLPPISFDNTATPTSPSLTVIGATGSRQASFGYASSLSTYDQTTLASYAPRWQFVGGAPVVDRTMSLWGFSSTAAEGPLIVLNRSKSATVGTHANVAASDVLGEIRFQGAGSNPSNNYYPAAWIRGVVNSSGPSFPANEVYGGIEFSWHGNLPDLGFLCEADNVTPLANARMDFGKTAIRWKNIYLSGTLIAGGGTLGLGKVTLASGVGPSGAANAGDLWLRY